MSKAKSASHALAKLASDPAFERHVDSLRRLGEDLANNDGGLWAHVDLFALFDEGDDEPPPSRGQTVVSWLEGGRNVLILVPLVVTWFGIYKAIGAYDRLLAVPPEQREGLAGASFVQMWTSGFGGRTWWSFDRVALIDAAVIFTVITLSALVGILRSRVEDAAARRRRADADRLKLALRDACLEVAAQTGQVPQKLPEEIGKVVPVLQGLLQDLRDAERDLAASYAEGAAYTRELAKASAELVGATQDVGNSARDFEASVKALETEVSSLLAGTTDISAKIQTLLGTQQSLASSQRGLADAQDRTAQRLSEVADIPHTAAAAALRSAEALSGAVAELPRQVEVARDGLVAAVRDELSERRRAAAEIEAAGSEAAAVAASARTAIAQLADAVDALGKAPAQLLPDLGEASAEMTALAAGLEHAGRELAAAVDQSRQLVDALQAAAPGRHRRRRRLLGRRRAA